MPPCRARAASTTTRNRCASSPSSRRNMRASTDSISPGRRSKAWSSITARSAGPRAGAVMSRRAPCRNRSWPICAKQDLELASFASVEAQAAALADDIAYNNHDIDDGYRAGLFSFAELAEVPIAARALAEVRDAYPGIEGTRLLYESIRRLITWMIEDAVAESERRLATLAPRSAGDVRHAQAPMVAFSEMMQPTSIGLRAFSSLPSLPPSPHRPHHGRSGGRGARSVRPLQRRSAVSAARMARAAHPRAARKPMPAISATSSPA